jgi:predicted unusual protein kinase regulating ubiquinone biosynthesis (AarF/ABC1/UbiB family)
VTDPSGSSEFSVPQGRFGRGAPLVRLTLRTAGSAAVAALRGRLDADHHRRAAERYAELLGGSRGALMKAGQVLSLTALAPAVPDDQRHVYRAALNRLHDDAPPMPDGLAEDLIEAELGVPLQDVFAVFDPRPLAAASIGQVHAATLADGRRVAVKVQYPGVAEAIRADLRNGQLLTTFLRLGAGLTGVRADVEALAREIAARIEEETDYRVEADRQARFADAYRGHPFIRVPDVIPELSTGRILTMELAEGHRWSRALTASPVLRDRWGEVIYRFAVGSLHRLGMLNADPQPGNYLFHDDGTVTFLDFGCVKHHAAEQIRMLQAAAQATVDGDAARLHRVLADAGYLDSGDPPGPADLLAWLGETLAPIVAPQPFTFTPELASTLVRAGLSSERSAVTRGLVVPADLIFLARVNHGLTSVLGALRATGEWDAIRREYAGTGGAATPLGERERRFWRA